MSDRDDPGQEAIKTAREKFAKKKDDPAGIAAAKPGSNSIKSSLDETDPQRKSQVLPQMYNKFGMIQNVLKSSSSGQQGQSQAQYLAGQPEYNQDLDGNTKDMLISALTHGFCILVRNFGYDKVWQNIKNSTTGFYTQAELDALGWKDPNFEPTTFRFDRFAPDYQDVIVTSATLLYQLNLKYGEKNIPFLAPFYKPLTVKKPPAIVKEPSKYSVLRFFIKDELPILKFDGNVDVKENNFISVANNFLVNNDIVIYNPEPDSQVITGLTVNSYYSVIEANTSGFKLAAINTTKPTNIKPSPITQPVVNTAIVIIKGSPVLFNGVNVSAVVTDKYITFLKRQPDPEGQKYWEGILVQYMKLYSYYDAIMKINADFKGSAEYLKLNTPRANTANLSPAVVTTIANNSVTLVYSTASTTLPAANAVLNVLEPYSGYAQWEKFDGGLEYTIRTEYLPDFETPDELVVYLSAYAFAYDLFPVIPKYTLDNNLLGLLLKRYTKKIEDDYENFTVGWGVAADRDAAANDFNQNPETGGSGSGQSMLNQLLPQLKQLMQQTQQKHLPNSVLEQGKMRKLLENFEQKKTENKRMANFADDAVGGDGISGIGGMFQNGNFDSLMGQFKSGGGGGGGGTGATGGTGGGATGVTTGTGTTTGTTTTGTTATGTGVTRTANTTQVTAQTKLDIKPAVVIAPITGPDVYYKDVNLSSFIKDTYKTFLNRNPDKEGYDYWINFTKKEMDRVGFPQAAILVKKYFTTSAEYIQKQKLAKTQTVVTVMPEIKTDKLVGFEGKL